jgi:hypothetical protein
MSFDNKIIAKNFDNKIIVIYFANKIIAKIYDYGKMDTPKNKNGRCSYWRILSAKKENQ